MRRTLLLGYLFISAMILGGLLSGSAQAQDKVAVFMKVKLKHSQEVLKGLATEDFDLIAVSLSTVLYRLGKVSLPPIGLNSCPNLLPSPENHSHLIGVHAAAYSNADAPENGR